MARDDIFILMIFFDELHGVIQYSISKQHRAVVGIFKEKRTYASFVSYLVYLYVKK